MFVIGIPLVYLEVCLGQFSGTSSLFVWRLCPLFKGIGWGATIVSGMISIYYIAILAWTMPYLINSFYPTLPWSTCRNWWNTDHCIDRNPSNVTGLNSTMTTFSANVTTPLVSDAIHNLEKWNTTDSFLQKMLTVEGKGRKTATEEFWEYGVLHKSAGLEDMGVLQPHLVGCLFASWLLVFLCLVKGVKSVGKVVYVTALLPYILLTILLVRGLLLPGAIDGILFYVYPDFTKLANFNVWVEAGIQVFISLGTSFGPLITMASFNDFNNNCFRASVAVCLADALSSFFNGFVVFSVVGFIAKEANVTVTEVASQGPGVVLIAYPEAVSLLPVPQLWAVLFFLMLLLLGLDTQFGLVENVLTSIIDAFPRQLSRHRTLVTAGITSAFFLLGLPMTMNGGIYIYQLIDWFATSFWVWLAAFLECLVIGWIYGVGRFCQDVELMLGRQPGTLMKFSWCISTPLIVLGLVRTNP
ncbi:sodium- and chloride-dependent creatine transporter 1-like [Haliotis rubra]|uniref:sodium- and chloride-dependent creatine transporter 1-like n=1 Tax=Haliotis rubra TaxID=36100 RepID=UPI001EE5A826|nr:sodium- and chloride-dependent creatine transporter 1-like [Haliotis rubra]